MYPASFEYLAPKSLDEALGILQQRGDEVKILAGGQSLIPMMKLRFASPPTLMDINRIPGLDEIGRNNGTLEIGALVRHNDVVRSEAAKTNHTVATAAPWVADPIVRNLGTVAGSLAHHDPEGDWASVMLACDAELTLTSSGGERTRLGPHRAWRDRGLHHRRPGTAPGRWTAAGMAPPLRRAAHRDRSRVRHGSRGRLGALDNRARRRHLLLLRSWVQGSLREDAGAIRDRVTGQNG